jgi:hypothetical protein
MPNVTDFAAFLLSFQSQKFRALRAAQAYVLDQYNNFLTHLNDIDAAADASAGSIKVLPKDAMIALWGRVKILLSLYRDQWALDDMGARSTAAEKVRLRIPEAGWLIRALDGDVRIVATERLLAERPLEISGAPRPRAKGVRTRHEITS